MPSCCVCRKNDYGHRDLSFHCFPSDKSLSSKWMQLTGVKDDRYRVVCSLHFTDDAFKKVQHGSKGKRRLKFGYLPTVNVTQSSTQSLAFVDPIHSLISDTISIPDVRMMTTVDQLDSANSYDTNSVSIEHDYAVRCKAPSCILLNERLHQEIDKLRTTIQTLETDLHRAIHMELSKTAATTTMDCSHLPIALGELFATADVGTQTQSVACGDNKTVESAAVQCCELDFIHVNSFTVSENVSAAQHCTLSLDCSQQTSSSQTTQHTDIPCISQTATYISACDSQLTDSQPTDNHSSDGTYEPEIDSDMDCEQTMDKTATKLEDITKYLVFETELDKLFTFCSICQSPIVKIVKNTAGSMLSITSTCQFYHTVTWNSQPSIRRMPAGNLLISAAVLLSGSSYSKFLRFSELLRMPVLCESEFYRIQKTYLFPPINDYWTNHQTAILSAFLPDDLHLCGDARSDSPGYSAKYTSYTLMDMKTSLILDQQLVTVTEVANSVAMEVEGLERSLSFLISSRMKIHTLATDRHSSVQRLLKETYPQINHQFDIWHISKSIKKKLHKKALKKSASQLMAWIPCIGNHLYWCADTCGGNADLLREKWLSCVHHVVNCHQWNGELVMECGHGPLDTDGDEEFAWLTEDSDAHKALKTVVQDKRLLKDIGKCTDCCQTGSLESYHNLILSYAPKRLHFQYAGQQTRLQLAALDHNHNVGRELAKDKAGNPKVRQVFSKARKIWCLRNVYECKTYTYLDEIMHKIIDRRADDTICMDDSSSHLALPSFPSLATTERPDLQYAIQHRYKRIPDKEI